MKQSLRTFLRRDDGAVTVDWVVLTALVVGLLAAGYSLMESGALGLAGGTADYMTSYEF
jgi:Flp pilus assembly pilin Flp